MSDTDDLKAMRHSLAHIMASAIKNLWPKAKFGVGPVVENGFYYDIDLGEIKLSEDDFEIIEVEMKKIIKEDQKFILSHKNINEALKWAKENNQPYKNELLNDLKRSGTTDVKDLDLSQLGRDKSEENKLEEVTFYSNGNFEDLCRGPHVESTGKVGHFKLVRLSGAYWRGKESNPQMQRLYGVAFKIESELKEYMTMQEDAKKYDHRKLGQELDLFLISPLVGAGLPLFTPRGAVLREELNKYSQELRRELGFENVWTPHIAKQELYEKSGHWAKFGDEWLTVESKETHDNLVMKPMNCPHHQQIFAFKQRSYRDLPIRYMETATVYRDEKAGELLGLARVRSINQDDGHTFCTIEQIEGCIEELVGVVKLFYKNIGMDLKVRLSLRDDSSGYLGDEKLWSRAEKILKDIAISSGLEYYEAPGEAAFYGPKIDFMGKDALGRELQLATPQLDFVQPERFGLKYIDENGDEKTPVMIHFALMGSIERFLASYIEHTKGRFPVWVSPEQLRIITVNQEDLTTSFANEVLVKAKKMGLRAVVDNSNQSVGKKIRSAELFKVPYTIVIGEKEIKTSVVSPRVREDLKNIEEDVNINIDKFLEKLLLEYQNRLIKSSL
jgi:threonyl-tRNA synthetase